MLNIQEYLFDIVNSFTSHPFPPLANHSWMASLIALSCCLLSKRRILHLPSTLSFASCKCVVTQVFPLQRKTARDFCLSLNCLNPYRSSFVGDRDGGLTVGDICDITNPSNAKWPETSGIRFLHVNILGINHDLFISTAEKHSINL